MLAVRRAESWTVVIEDEIANERKAANPKAAAAVSPPQSGAPVIDVVEPDPGRPVGSPFNIRINFRPQPGASIVPGSFRAKYGWLGVDITDRLTGHAKIDASGIVADGAEISAGQYRITLQIADNLGRVGTRVLEFRVI